MVLKHKLKAGFTLAAAMGHSRGSSASLLVSSVNSDLKLSQRHAGPLFCALRGCPGDVCAGSIESRSQSAVMQIGCRETLIQFTSV